MAWQAKEDEVQRSPSISEKGHSESDQSSFTDTLTQCVSPPRQWQRKGPSPHSPEDNRSTAGSSGMAGTRVEAQTTRDKEMQAMMALNEKLSAMTMGQMVDRMAALVIEKDMLETEMAERDHPLMQKVQKGKAAAPRTPTKAPKHTQKKEQQIEDEDELPWWEHNMGCQHHLAAAAPVRISQAQGQGQTLGGERPVPWSK